MISFEIELDLGIIFLHCITVRLIPIWTFSPRSSLVLGIKGIKMHFTLIIKNFDMNLNLVEFQFEYQIQNGKLKKN